MHTENNSCLSSVSLLSIMCNATTLLLPNSICFCLFCKHKKISCSSKTDKKRRTMNEYKTNLLNYSKPLECTCRADFIFPAFCHFPHRNLTNIDFTNNHPEASGRTIYAQQKKWISLAFLLDVFCQKITSYCTSEAHF